MRTQHDLSATFRGGCGGFLRSESVGRTILPAFILNKLRTKFDLHSILFILCFDGDENLRSNPFSLGNVLRPLCYLQGRLWGYHEDNKQYLHLFWKIKTGAKIDWQIILFLSCIDKKFSAKNWTLDTMVTLPRDPPEVGHGSHGCQEDDKQFSGCTSPTLVDLWPRLFCPGATKSKGGTGQESNLVSWEH